MSRSPRHRRPLIEALEPRLLFSATADIAVFDDGNSDVQHLAQAAQEVDLVSIYMSDESSMIESQSHDSDLLDSDPRADIPFSENAAITAVVFVDTSVAGYDALVDDIRSRFDNDSVAIIYLDQAKDGVEQITAALGQYRGLDSIHIISHGSAGAVELGNAILTDNSLIQYEDDLVAWGKALGADADILFYGCDVAINPAGQALIEKIARLTDADVAASSDVTGHESLGGDWDLEYKVGDIESGVLISVEAQQSFVGVMATTHFVNIQGGSSSQPFSSASNIGQTFLYDSAGPTYTINQISIQLKKDVTAANQMITLELREGGYNGTWLANATINVNALSTNFEWETFSLGNVVLNDNQTYCIRLISTSADGKVSAAYSPSNVWNNAELIVNGVANSSADMSLLVSYYDGSNSVPTVANPIPNQSTNEEAYYSYTFPANTFADADFPTTLTYTATLSNGDPLPSWLGFNATTRTFSGVPDDGDVGTISIRVTANDGAGGTVNDNFDLVINNVNDLPFVNIPIPNQNATEDSAFNYTFPANTFGDGDIGAVFTYTAELASGGSLPSWLQFDSATRTFSGTPLNGDVGTISVKVIANDGGGATVSDNFDIVIANTNDAPTIANQIPNQIATENVLLNYTFPINTFNDQDSGDSLTYTAQRPGGIPLPAWLSFDSVTRTFSGIPSNGDVGNFTVEVIASDGTTTVSDFFDIAVQNVGSSNVVYETSGPSTDTQVISAGVPFFQSFFHNSIGATYTIDSIILQLVKDPTASAQTITVSLLSGTYNGTLIKSTSILSADIGTSLGWKAFDFTNIVLNDNQLYFIRIESTSADGLVKAAIHNTDVYANGSYHSSGGSADITRDVAFQISSGANNNPVIANPIPNQNATEDAAFNFQFNSNTFSDIDVGDTLTYSATMADGSSLPSWLSFNAATRTFSGTPANGDVGTISIKVTADDGQGGTPATDTFDVVIANTNDAPTVANPIPNQNATEDSAFNFTFASNTFTDQDVGDTLTYSVQLAGGGTLPTWLSFDPVTRTFSGTPLNAHVGTLSIDVIANDGKGGTVIDTFNIIIANTNDAPIVANTMPNQNAAEGSIFIFQFAANTFSDPDVGDTLTYSAQLSGGGVLPGWLLFNPGNRTFSGIPAQADVGTIAIDVIASDGNGGTVIDTFNIVIAPTNDAPTVTIPSTDYFATEQVPIDLHGTGISVADEDDDPLTITITGAGSNSNLAAGVGTTGVIVVSGTNTNTLVLTGTAAQLNDLFAGNNGGTLTYRLSGDTPAATRLLTISASDGSLSGSDTATINITAVNDAPENTVPGAQVTIEDTALVFSAGNGNSIQIDDPDAGSSNVEVTLSVTNGTLTLAGITGLGFTTGDGTADSTLVFTGTLANINAALASLTFNPALNYHGAAVLSITTSDLGNTGTGGTLTATDTVNITINASNDAPTVANPIPNQNATEDAAFNFQFASNTFADVDGDSLTYSVQLSGGAPLPSWLTYDPATRTFSGTPANGDVGTISIDVIANDGNGGTITDTFNIVVANTNDAPTVANPIPNQNATEDAAFNFQFASNTFADVDGDSLTYSAQLNGGAPLPSWLTYDPATRTFSGTPTNGDVGTISVDVIANDGNGGTITDTFNIVVANTNDAPTVANPISNQNATEDAAFNFQFASNTFADVDGDSLTYSVQLSGGAPLPSWLTYDPATRTFSGTPANGDVGTISVDVIANDGNGGTITDTFNIVIANTNDAPTVANPIPDRNATQDAAFSFQFAANTFNDIDVGDTLTYSVQLAGGGSLPAWLTYDPATRTFSGTPANGDVGTLSIDVIANDGNGGTVTNTFDIVIANANDAPTVANPIPNQNATEDTAFNFQFASNTFADVDGDSLTYSVQLNGGTPLPSWLTYDPATRTFSGTPTNGDVGTISVDVIANDGNGGTITDTFNIVVANTNDAPTVANPIPDRVANENTVFNFQFAANTFNDIDVGDTLSYSAQLAGGGLLPSWLSFNAATRTFNGVPSATDTGSISIDVIASDGNGGLVTDTFTITVAGAPDTEYIDTGNGGNFNPVSSTNQLGQSFSYDSAGATYTVNEISLSLARYDNAAPQTITVELRDSWNGAILASASIPSSQISRDGFGWHSFSFGDVALNDQQTYVIQISSSGTDDLVLVSRFSSDVYADGSLIENGVPNASGWDLAFKVSKDDGANAAPVLDNPVVNQTIDAELPFNLVVPPNTFSDPDANDTITYRAQLAGGGSLGWLTFNEATRTFSGTPHWYQAGTMTVELIATDNHGASTSSFFDIDVINTNTAPTVANPIPDVVTNEDAAFNFQFAANTFGDVDVGNTFTYSAELAVLGGLPPWLSFDAATRTFSGTPANGDVGTWTVEVTANDGFGGAVIDTFVITVANTNDAPTLANNIPDRTATQGSSFNFQFAANTFADQDVGDVLTYTVQLSGGGSLPAWLHFDSATRTFSGTPGNSDVGTLSIEVIADDSSGGTVSDTFDIVVNNINDAPTVANPIADQNATEDTNFTLQFAANTFDDVDVGSTLTYSAQLSGGAALPAWLGFDPVTRTFSGTPLNADVGTITIDVIANDGLGGTVTDTFVIVIANTNDAPTLANPIPDQNATESLAFNFTFAANTFNDEDVGDVFIYSAQLAGGGALPSWLIFDAVTRTFSGTPTSANLGSISIEVIASDGNGGTITDTFALAVTALPVNAPPVLQNAIADQSANEDSLFRFTIPANTFVDADGDALGYSARMADGSAMPSWLNFDAATRTFSGTPANDDVGNIEIIISVSDGNGGSASDTFVITVNNTNDAPVLVIPPANQIAEEDVPFTVTFPANMFADVDAGTRLSYSAQLANGDPLPAWLKFDATTLTFSGTPADGDAGTLSIQLIASDGIATAAAQFQLAVLAVNDAPVTSGFAPITNVEDASGNVVDLFSAFADDDDAPNQLQYSVVGNTNPALVSGAVIDPVTGKLQLSYGANQFGNAELIIRAQDSEGALVETVLKITITPVNDTPTSTGIADVKVQAGAAAQQTNLHSAFNDIEDGTALRYSLVGNTNPAVATSVQIDPATGMMTLAFAPASGGESIITLRAMDADGAWVETHFKVTVTARDTSVPVTPEEPGKPPTTQPPVIPPVVVPPTETPGGDIPTTPPEGGSGGVTDPLLPTNPDDALDPGLPGTGNPGSPDLGAEGDDDPRKEYIYIDDKSSRDFARADELLKSGNVPLTTLNASSSLVSLITPDAGFAPWEAADFDNEVRRIRAQMDEAMEEEHDRKAVVAGITFSVTTGLLIWSLRASSLLLTMMSMLPLWRGLDPLPILEEVNKKKKELEQQRKDREHEDKSAKEVGYLFDHAQSKDSKP